MMPDTPAPLREALREAVERFASAHGAAMWNPTARAADYDRTRTAKARVDALLSHIPIDLEATEGRSEPSVEQQISELPLPVRNAIIGPNDMRRRLELDLEAKEGDDG